MWLKSQEHLSSKGLRVLAMCRGEIPDDQDMSEIDPKYLRSMKPHLTFMGLLAILDPPREEVIDAVKVRLATTPVYRSPDSYWQTWVIESQVDVSYNLCPGYDTSTPAKAF